MFTSVSSRSASAYKRVGIETSVDNADPHKLVVLLFDALQQTSGQCPRSHPKWRHVPEQMQTHQPRHSAFLKKACWHLLNLQEGGELARKTCTICIAIVCNRLTMANIRSDAAVHRRGAARHGACRERMEADQWPRSCIFAARLMRGVLRHDTNADRLLQSHRRQQRQNVGSRQG